MRYVKEFYGGSKAITEINDWVNKYGFIIVSITPIVTLGASTYYLVLYEVSK